MADNIIKVNVTASKPKSVTVSSSQVGTEITASPDTGKFWAQTAMNWAVSDVIVDNIDYSSKYYANKAKGEANSAKNFAETSANTYQNLQETSEETLNTLKTKTQEAIDTIALNSEQVISNIETTEKDVLENIETAKNNALNDINTIGVEYVNNTEQYAQNALNSANNAKTSEDNALNSANNAKTSEDNALSYKNSAMESSQTAIEQANIATQKAEEATTSANNAKTSETNAKSSETRCEEILSRLGTAIKVKGRANSLDDLPLSGNLDGDTYLIGEEGLDSYPEYYWYQDHWEFLGTSGTSLSWGLITGNISAQTDLQNALNGKANDSTVVHKTGNESISGIKTFNDNIKGKNSWIGTKLTPYIYSTSLNPTSQFYWYKIFSPKNRDTFATYEITAHGDSNYAYFAKYTVAISSYSTNKACNVNVYNHGLLGTTNLKVAMDADGNVYMSTNCIWGTYFSINNYAGTDLFEYENMGYAPWGDTAGFESIGMITDSGAMRYLFGDKVTYSEPLVYTPARKAIQDGEGRNIVNTYQQKLTAGDNIKIENDVISSTSAGLQMFDTILKDHILTYEETQGWALQGTYVYKEALAGSRYGYPDFYAKCVEEFNEATNTETVNGVTVKVHSNGHKFYDIADKGAIDTFFGTMGTAWFYGVDIENERIFLPRNNYFEQATGDIAKVGQSVEAGLPNITGTFGGIEATGFNPTGAFADAGTGNIKGAAASGNAGDPTVSFDASRSNPIYGNSETVQPNAIKKLLYICVGNTTNYEGVTNVINQGMEILEQVNQGIETRVKLDGSNAQFTYITETFSEGTSWYRVYSDGWCEQGGHLATGGAQTVTFLKPFKDTNYIILGTPLNTAYNTGVATSNRTTTTAVIGTYQNIIKCDWEAKGYIA